MRQQLSASQKIARGNRRNLQGFERAVKGVGRSVERSLMRPSLGTIVIVIMAMIMCAVFLAFYGAILGLGILAWGIARPFDHR